MKTGVHVYEVENNFVGLPTFLFSTFPTILFSLLQKIQFIAEVSPVDIQVAIILCAFLIYILI